MYSDKIFPDKLKIADVIPVFRKKHTNNEANYQPISLLSNISKIIQGVLFEKIKKFAKKILSPKWCGFRKVHFTQHALLNLLQNLQKT